MLIQCWHWGWVKAEALLLMTFFWNCERQCRWWKTGSALMTTTPFIQKSKKVLGYWAIIKKISLWRFAFPQCFVCNPTGSSGHPEDPLSKNEPNAGDQPAQNCWTHAWSIRCWSQGKPTLVFVYFNRLALFSWFCMLCVCTHVCVHACVCVCWNIHPFVERLKYIAGMNSISVASALGLFFCWCFQYLPHPML